MELGPTELIIILVIVLLLFGPGRIANLGGELGKAIHEFRRGVGDGPPKEEPAALTPVTDPPLTTVPTTETVSEIGISNPLE